MQGFTMQKKIFLIIALIISFLLPVTKGWSQVYDLVPESVSYSSQEPQRSNSFAYGFRHTLSHFPSSYLTFHIALGAMALWDCFIRMKDNPMACEEFEQSLTDPIAFSSFFLFMMSNHTTLHFLKKHLTTPDPGIFLNKQLPSHTGASSFIQTFLNANKNIIRKLFLKPEYIGLAAGMVVSHIAVDILTDPNIKYLATNLFSFKKNAYEKDQWSQALDATEQRWFYEEGMLRWRAYTPDMIAVILSVVAANGSTMLTQKGVSLMIQSLVRKGIIDPRGNTLPGMAALKLGRSSGIFHAFYSQPSGLKHGVGLFTNNILRGAITLGSASLTRIRLHWSLAILQMIHFFAWNDYMAPHVEQWWDIAKIAHRMKYEESAILHHLASGYQVSPSETQIESSPDKGFLASFVEFFRGGRSSLHQERIENNIHLLNIQDTLFGFLNLPQTQQGHENLQYLNKHKSIFNHVPDLTVMTNNPFETHQKNNDHIELATVSDFEDEMQNPVEDNKESKPRGDFLLEHINRLDASVNQYRGSLYGIQNEVQRWNAFLLPASANYHTTYNFYKHVIKSADQISFENPSTRHNKSRGMLNALYFNSRPLSLSNAISAQQLHLESQLLQHGLMPELVHTLSESESNAQKILHKLDSSSDEEHALLITYLNAGFNIRRIDEFEKFDYQVHIEGLKRGISKIFLESYTTEKLYEFIQKLDEINKNQDVYIEATYYFPLEYITAEMDTEINDPLYVTILIAGLEQKRKQEQEQAGEESENSPSNVPDVAISEYPNIMYPGAEYFDKGHPDIMPSFHIYSSSRVSQEREHGIDYFSTVEKLLIDMVCGPSLSELLSRSQLFEREGLFSPGALTFNAPRLWREKPSFCMGGLRLRNVHHAFLVLENNERTYYHNLLDYISQKINTSEDTEHFKSIENFDQFWKDIESAKEHIFNEYEAIQWNAFYEEFSQKYDLTDYKHYHSLSSPVNALSLHNQTSRKPYAQGIHQFEKDLTNYYIQLLVSVLPKQSQDDKNFLTGEVHPLIEQLKILSQFPGNRLLPDTDMMHYIPDEDKEDFAQGTMYYQHLLLTSIVIKEMDQKINAYLREEFDSHKMYVHAVIRLLLKNIHSSIHHANTMNYIVETHQI